MRSIPVTILAGSDRRATELPANAAGMHPLAVYKAVALEVRGRPIVEHLVERINATPGLGPAVIAGPARLYEPLGLEAELLDTDGSVGTNLRASIEHHQGREAGAEGCGPMAVLACDVLPSVEELRDIRARYEVDAPTSALWFPFVRVPEDKEELGAFGWKPTYALVPGPGQEPVRILPGHLGIFDPDTLRLRLLFRLMDAAYRTRNLGIVRRRAAMMRKVLFGLMAFDLQLLVRGRLPNRTITVLVYGLRLASRLRTGHLAVAELEYIIGRIFLRAPVARAVPERGIRYPIVDFLSLAQDVDTQEEARWIAHRGAEGS